MRKIFICSILICMAISSVFAVKITPFMDTDTLIKRAQDIIVAECTSILPQETMENGFRAAEVNILKVLKGGNKPEHFRIATIYEMKPNTTYMLYSIGGNALGTDFLAIPELSVVPLPATFKLEDLKDKDVKEQVQYMFSRRLFEVERELAPLLKEKELLEKGISDSSFEWYESNGPVKIGPIIEINTQTDKTKLVWLAIDGKKLEWSQTSPGKSGCLYFEKADPPRTPYWEFSPCNSIKIEDLADKPLKAKFYGMYSPGRGETPLRWTGVQSIDVNVGQVLLARTIDEPDKIFIIQIKDQQKDKEQMSARYTVSSRSENRP
jgi:hypothetical protein